ARAARLAAIVLASSLIWFSMGHFLTLDMTLSVFLALARGALCLAQGARDDAHRNGRWMLVAWGSLRLATRTTDPDARVHAAGTTLLSAFWQRARRLWRALHIGKGLALFLALVAPWFVVMGLSNPGFTSFFFLHEHLERFAPDVAGRVHPWWTFVPV